MDETIIISLGGSLVVPEDLDTGFLINFRNLILDHVKEGKKFVIITGGGKIARKYQEAGKILDLTKDHLDWLGIYSTRINAEFTRLIFREHAKEEIITDPTQPVDFNKPIILGGGYKPGWSTDYVAVLLAQNIKAKKIINLSNMDYVYTDDPKKNPLAEKIEQISWEDYRKLIPKEWSPGLSSPFDPMASELAEKENIEVAIMNGQPLDHLSNYLEGKEFQGTIIKNDN